jgi:hypothetical protein
MARENGWIVPAAIFSVGLITVGSWMPDPFSEQRAANLRMVDAEHGILCQKFGFQASSDQYSQCKAALLRLWDFHKDIEVSY